MSISARHVEELIDAVASDEPVPGGGAVSGIAAALAAGLAAMAARYALRHDPDSALFTDLTDRADALRARAVALAYADADAYGRYVAAADIPADLNLRGRAGDTRIMTARAHAAAAAACARRAVAAGSDFTASDSKADSGTRSSR